MDTSLEKANDSMSTISSEIQVENPKMQSAVSKPIYTNYSFDELSPASFVSQSRVSTTKTNLKISKYKNDASIAESNSSSSNSNNNYHHDNDFELVKSNQSLSPQPPSHRCVNTTSIPYDNTDFVTVEIPEETGLTVRKLIRNSPNNSKTSSLFVSHGKSISGNKSTNSGNSILSPRINFSRGISQGVP